MDDWDSIDATRITDMHVPLVVYVRTCVRIRVCRVCVYVYLCIQTMSSLTRSYNSLSGMRFYDEAVSDVLSARLAACESAIECEARFSPFWIFG